MALHAVSFVGPVSELAAVDATPVLPGEHAVGLRHLHAVDESREDPSTGQRQFMVSVFYPAHANTDAQRASLADLLLDNPAEALRGIFGDDADDAAAYLACLKLRACRELVPLSQTFPVLIYYPGGQSHRLSNAGICESLASLGYVVFTLDAPRDAPLVVFPDGKIVIGPLGDENYITPRVADVLFLLNGIEQLPPEVAGVFDLLRIGMFGSSRGGYLSNIVAVEDARIRAAVNMDGFLWGLWTDGTGLQKYPDEFQRKARALETPILRLKGEQSSRDAVREQFDEEKLDFGGDFLMLALHGFTHSDFGLTSWLCGAPEKLLENLRRDVAPAQRCELLLRLLRQFFGAYLSSEPGLPEFCREESGDYDGFYRMGEIPAH